MKRTTNFSLVTTPLASIRLSPTSSRHIIRLVPGHTRSRIWQNMHAAALERSTRFRRVIVTLSYCVSSTSLPTACDDTGALQRTRASSHTACPPQTQPPTCPAMTQPLMPHLQAHCADENARQIKCNHFFMYRLWCRNKCYAGKLTLMVKPLLETKW